MRYLRLTVGIAAALALISSGSTAHAHAAYKSSDPPDKGQVSSPPSQVTAEFTEPLAGGSFLQVTDPCGERVDGGDVSISGYTMSVSMSGSATGRYTVFYKAYSQLDPHVTQGEFSFTSSSGDPCEGDEPEPERENGSGGGVTGAPGTTGGSTMAPGSTGEDGSSERATTGGAAGSRSSRREGGGVAGSGRESTAQRNEQGARVPNIAAADREAEARPVWDGIRLESFLTGLLLAAIIGAAGGKIYAGIMGPRA